MENFLKGQTLPPFTFTLTWAAFHEIFLCVKAFPIETGVLY